MSIETGKNIMVYVGIANGKPLNASLEAITQARQLANSKQEQVVAVFIGKELDSAFPIAIQCGADHVLVVEEERQEAEVLAQYLYQCKEKYSPRILFIASTPEGKDIGAMLASKSKIPALNDVVNIREENSEVFYTFPMYSGNILKEVKIALGKTAIVILRAGVCKKEVLEGRAEEIHKEVLAPVETKGKLLESVKEIAEDINLEEAKVIVAGGRGMGSKENFELIHKLAEVCGGVVGATRPATEENWVGRSHQIGQSGKMVAPQLYIACGISGATQHISGALASDFIVAINKDEDASIFEVSDLGIVGNAMDILPHMIEEIQKRKCSSI